MELNVEHGDKSSLEDVGWERTMRRRVLSLSSLMSGLVAVSNLWLIAIAFTNQNENN